MGPRQEAQAALFHEFSLEDRVPQDRRDRLPGSFDRFVDPAGIRAHLADFHSHAGRPSVDPETPIRMLPVGYCFGIGAERRLREEVHSNLAYRWFRRLDPNDRVPDRSTFSKNRHGRFRESELLRHLFETTVARCIEEGPVSGRRMAIDASSIEADANKRNPTPKEHWDAAGIDLADAPALCASTPTRWMRPRLGPPARRGRGSPPIPIRRANGRLLAKALRSLAISTITRAIRTAASSSMWKQLVRSGGRRSDRRRRCSSE